MKMIMIEREEAQKIYEHLIQEYIDHLEKLKLNKGE